MTSGKSQAILLVIAACGLFLIFRSVIPSSREKGLQPDSRTTIRNRSHTSSLVKAENSSTKSSRSVAQNKSSSISKKPKGEPSWDSLASSFDRLKALKKCYDQEGLCGFPQNDPREEFFAIGQQIKKELLVLQDRVHLNGEKSSDLAALARDLMQVPDGHVKEAALHLLSTQELSEKSLHTILDEILDYHDANLIQQAMMELNRYKDPSSRRLIVERLQKILITGSPLVANEASLYLSLFMNSETIVLFKITLERLTLGSQTYRNLKSQIENFERSQTSA